MTTQIKAGGKDRPFRISFKGLRRFTKSSKLGLGQLEEALTDLDNLLLLILIGFQEGAKKEGLVIDFKAEDVEDWIDEDFELIEVCSNAIGDNIGGKEKESKKSPPKRKPLPDPQG